MRDRSTRRRYYRRFIMIRLALLAALLVATFVFHVGGATAVDLRIVRIAIVAAIVIGGGWLVRHREAPRG